MSIEEQSRRLEQGFINILDGLTPFESGLEAFITYARSFDKHVLLHYLCAEGVKPAWRTFTELAALFALTEKLEGYDKRHVEYDLRDMLPDAWRTQSWLLELSAEDVPKHDSVRLAAIAIGLTQLIAARPELSTLQGVRAETLRCLKRRILPELN